MTPTCTRCGIAKPLLAFPRAPTCVSGVRSYCKDCDRDRKNKWRAENYAAWYAKCVEWKQQNGERVRASKRKYNQKSVASGEAAQRHKASRDKNKPLYNAATSARRRKLANARPKWVSWSSLEAVYMQAQLAGMTVDHIIPITHPLVCGLHVPWNLQLMTASENYKKSNSFDGSPPVRTSKAYTRKQS